MEITIRWEHKQAHENSSEVAHLMMSEMEDKIEMVYIPATSMFQSHKVKVYPGKYTSQFLSIKVSQKKVHLGSDLWE